MLTICVYGGGLDEPYLFGCDLQKKVSNVGFILGYAVI